MATLTIFDAHGIERSSKGEDFGIEIKVNGKAHVAIVNYGLILELIKNHSSYTEKTLSLSDDTEVVDTQKSKYKSLGNGV